MSGGHYTEYMYFRFDDLAREIEKDILKIEEGTSWLETEATKEQKELLLKHMRQLVEDLKYASERAYLLDYLFAGDVGIENYLKRYKGIRKFRSMDEVKQEYFPEAYKKEQEKDEKAQALQKRIAELEKKLYSKKIKESNEVKK